MTSLHSIRGRLGAHGVVALVAIVAALIALLVSARQFLPAFFAPAPEVTAAADTRQYAQQYALALDGHIQQFDGRSLFFIPSAPPPPPPPPRPREDPGPPPPPAPPSRYEGPAIIAMLNDTAWFDDGSKLRSGESSSSIRVIRIDPPWSARVEWKGVEFTVGLFERDRIVMPAPQAPAPARAPAAEPTPGTPQAPEASRLTNGDDPIAPAADPDPPSPDHASKDE